jgi:hypothetical protein
LQRKAKGEIQLVPFCRAGFVFFVLFSRLHLLPTGKHPDFFNMVFAVRFSGEETE